MTQFENLITLTTKMRGYQKEYFTHRNSTALVNAKRLEREVDKLLEEIKQGKSFATIQKLF